VVDTPSKALVQQILHKGATVCHCILYLFWAKKQQYETHFCPQFSESADADRIHNYVIRCHVLHIAEHVSMRHLVQQYGLIQCIRMYVCMYACMYACQ
jgi:hypothetical protein